MAKAFEGILFCFALGGGISALTFFIRMIPDILIEAFLSTKKTGREEIKIKYKSTKLYVWQKGVLEFLSTIISAPILILANYVFLDGKPMLIIPFVFYICFVIIANFLESKNKLKDMFAKAVSLLLYPIIFVIKLVFHILIKTVKTSLKILLKIIPKFLKKQQKLTRKSRF